MTRIPFWHEPDLEEYEEDCPECNGEGTTHGLDECDNCGGDGYLNNDPEWYCSGCNGEGFIPADETCERCGGTGKYKDAVQRDFEYRVRLRLRERYGINKPASIRDYWKR